MNEVPAGERREYVRYPGIHRWGRWGMGAEGENNDERTDCIYNARQTLASRFHHRKSYPWIIKERSTRAGADVKVGGGVDGNPNTELNPTLETRGGGASPNQTRTRMGGHQQPEFMPVALLHSIPERLGSDLMRSVAYGFVSRLSRAQEPTTSERGG